MVLIQVIPGFDCLVLVSSAISAIFVQLLDMIVVSNLRMFEYLP